MAQYPSAETGEEPTQQGREPTTHLNAVAKSSDVIIQFSALHSGSSRMRRVTDALDAWLQMFWMSEPVYPSVDSAMRMKSMFLQGERQWHAVPVREPSHHTSQ